MVPLALVERPPLRDSSPGKAPCQVARQRRERVTPVVNQPSAGCTSVATGHGVEVPPSVAIAGQAGTGTSFGPLVSLVDGLKSTVCTKLGF